MAQLAPHIGIISSIKYSGTLKDNFERGIGNSEADATQVTYATIDQVGYDQASLKQGVQNLIDQNVGIVVTVGGLAPAIAAKTTIKDRPFLSLIGEVTDDFDGAMSGWFYGGITLNTVRDNKKRIDDLKIPAGQVALLSDPNSSLAKTETEKWRNASRGRIISASDLRSLRRPLKILKRTAS